MNRPLLLLPLIAALTCACQAFAAPTASATPSATVTSSPTATVTASPAPSATASPSPTASATPTVTPSATVTVTPGITPTPSVTPMAAPRFVYDNWQVVDVLPALRESLETPMVAFINRNDRRPDYDVRTPRPDTNSQILYFAAPDGPRLAVLQTHATGVSHISAAPAGSALSWFVSEPAADAGVYVLDLGSGISGRVLAIDSLRQRGVVSEVQWAPDGSRLAIAVATAWAIDVFSIERDSGAFSNLTRSHSRDFWPSWSPDGRQLLFVSDRSRCPGGWQPGAMDGCDHLRDDVLPGGNPWLLDVASGALRQLSQRWISERPRWVNESLVTFVEGDLQRSLYLLDLVSGEERRVHPLDLASGRGSLSEVWSPDGSRVVLQDISSTAGETTLLDARGQRIAGLPHLTFPRYGMAAAWSPDGERVALGGINGNCPYGVRVLNARFEMVASGSAPPGMCDPAYSGDGQLAFTGVNPRIDGRIDVYVANRNGFGARNLSADLRGHIRLLGWVGG